MYKLMCVGIPPKAIPKGLEADEGFVARRMVVEEEDDDEDEEVHDLGMEIDNHDDDSHWIKFLVKDMNRATFPINLKSLFSP